MPCVVKPARPGTAPSTARVAEDAATLRELLDRLPGDEPLLAQERVIGPLVRRRRRRADGRLAARFQLAEQATWPADAGASARARSVAPHDALVERCRAMLAVGFTGLAQLQFLDSAGPGARRRQPAILRQPPAGAGRRRQPPAAWHAVVTSEGAPASDAYRLEATVLWVEADVTAARRGASTRLRRWAARSRAGAMWASDDPVPGAALVVAAVGARVARRVSGRDAA